jgi:hypothetical protein
MATSEAAKHTRFRADCKATQFHRACLASSVSLHRLKPTLSRWNEHSQRTSPALSFLDIRLRTSSSFSSNGLPENSSPKTFTFSFGRGGRSFPHTVSTKFCCIATRPAPPFFWILSLSLRASASPCQKRASELCNRWGVLTGGNDGRVYPYCLPILRVLNGPDRL